MLLNENITIFIHPSFYLFDIANININININK